MWGHSQSVKLEQHSVDGRVGILLDEVWRRKTWEVVCEQAQGGRGTHSPPNPPMSITCAPLL